MKLLVETTNRGALTVSVGLKALWSAIGRAAGDGPETRLFLEARTPQPANEMLDGGKRWSAHCGITALLPVLLAT